MELDLGTLLIGFFALLCCIVPFVIDYRRRKKKENNLLQPLKKAAEQQNFQMNDYEVCNNFIIGIDKLKNIFFFYSQEKDNAISKFIDLSTIENCKVITSHKTRSSATGSSKIINKLELSFVSSDKSKAEQTVDIFNADGFSRLNGEIQLADKWSKIVTNQLSSK